jgi:hypothetical protein
METWPSRRLLAIGLIVALAAIATRVAAPAPERHAHFSAALACGVERWGIKTLKDRPRLLRARKTTIAHLVSLPRPKPFPPPGRLPLERRIYSVIAAVTLDRNEADLDHHLVLRRGAKTMIAETPSSLCTVGATAYRRQQISDARNAARVCPRARVVGVALFDYNHGQTGVAPNAIELHPVLGFACLS